MPQVSGQGTGAATPADIWAHTIGASDPDGKQTLPAALATPAIEPQLCTLPLFLVTVLSFLLGNILLRRLIFSSAKSRFSLRVLAQQEPSNAALF